MSAPLEKGKIAGTVKLDGTAPHMRGIDMSKDPYCVKANATDPAPHGKRCVGSGGAAGECGCSTSLTGAVPLNQKPPNWCSIRRNCMLTPHVLAMDVNQNSRSSTSDQTTHNIHPNPNADDWQHSVESVSAARSCARREELEGGGSVPVQCNIHPWMHGWS